MNSMILCGLYYVVWMHLLPRWRGYQIRAEIVTEQDGKVSAHRLVKVPDYDVERWDASHDESGRLRHRAVESRQPEQQTKQDEEQTV